MQKLTSIENHEHWIPLLDYALKTGISLSTLRRHIKSNKLTYKTENGRYLILSHPSSESTFNKNLSDLKLKQLETEFQKAQEEIVELKTLIALYEEKIPQNTIDN